MKRIDVLYKIMWEALAFHDMPRLDRANALLIKILSNRAYKAVRAAELMMLSCAEPDFHGSCTEDL